MHNYSEIVKKREFYAELMDQQLSAIFIVCYIIDFCNSYRHVAAVT